MVLFTVHTDTNTGTNTNDDTDDDTDDDNDDVLVFLRYPVIECSGSEKSALLAKRGARSAPET